MTGRRSRLTIVLGVLIAALSAYLLVGLVVWLAGGRGQVPRPPAGSLPVLDGTRPIDQAAVAALARERALLGARWLAGASRPDGSFFYEYFPERGRFSAEDYNAIRHGGTTYSLYQVHDVTPDPRVLRAAERATRWIERNSPPTPDGRGRALLEAGKNKLGGQALALVALLERRRVTGRRDRDPLIRDMASFLASLEVPGQPGRYFQSYLPAGNRRLLEPASDYYPPEALLALTRLAQHFPRGPHLAEARQLADYLLRTRPGSLPPTPAGVEENQWLALALSELHRLAPRPAYRRAAFLQADSMRLHQFTAADDQPESIGAPDNRLPINYTSSATKAEALVAVWSLARRVGDAEAARRFAQAALRNVQFQMRVQFTPASASEFPRPRHAVGAWPQDPAVSRVRMDFVQHNISALITAWHMAVRGDLALQGIGPRR